MFGYDVYNNFFNIDSTGNMPMGANGLAGGHAVCVIGYSDAHKNLDGSVGALLVKNSWGYAWGCKSDGTPSNGTNGGYFWMPYNYVLKTNDNVGDAWIVVELSMFVNPTPTPTPTPTPVEGMLLNAVRGTDDHCWYQIRHNGVWSKWQTIGGTITSDTDVQKDEETGELCVTARGSDKASWHIYYIDGKWSAWESSGGQIKENGDLIIVNGVPTPTPTPTPTSICDTILKWLLV